MYLAPNLDKIIAYYGSLVLLGLMVGIIGPALDTLAVQINSTLSSVSVILALRPLGNMGGVLLAGRLMERMAGHQLLALATLLAGTMAALIPWIKDLESLAVVFLGLGFGLGILDVGSTILLTWIVGDRMGPYLSGLHFSFGLGAFLAPQLLTVSLTQGLGALGAFSTLAILALPLAAWQLRTSSPAHHLAASGTVTSWNRRRALTFVLLFFLYGGAESGFGAWIYNYTLAFQAVDLAGAALLTSLFWGLLSVGRLVGIPLLASVEAPILLRFMLPLAVLAISSLLLWPERFMVLCLGAGGMGLFMAGIFPAMLVHATHSLAGSERLSASLTSAFFMGSSTGAMVIPWLMGQTFESLGPRTAMAMVVVAILGIWVACSTLLKRIPTKNAKL